MSEPGFRSQGSGRFEVTGPLSFETVPGLLERSLAELGEAAEPSIDLGGVTQVDSAGLALIIEWMRAARARGHQLSFTGMPEKLRALARISEVDAFLDGSTSQG